MEKINVTKSSMPKIDEYIDEIKSIWDSHWLTNMGEKHNRLKDELESYLQVDHVELYTNGHLALENAIALFDFPKGSEIITTPFTFASTTHAIVRNEMVPVFCDITEDNYTIDVSKIERLITSKTVAILPVHVYGNICNFEAIDTIAKKYNLKVIYDAAHAFGVRYNGKSVANFGDISMFSFHATKVFNTIEGGALCFNNSAWVQKLNDMKNFGIRGPEDVAYVGGNAKMSEFQAAMGICNLRHIDDEICKRKAVYERYLERLEIISDRIKLNSISEKLTYNYAYFPIVIYDGKYSRDAVFKKLEENNIVARKYFYPLTSSYECYRGLFSNDYDNLDVAKNIAERILTLPIYADLSLDVVDKICDIMINM